MKPNPRWRACYAACGVALLVASTSLAGGPATADGSPARALPSPAASKLGSSDASQYWDLTVELENDYRVFARFHVTNQGPGNNNATAVGHVVAPDGKTTKFRNGRLESGWTLSKDRLDLDVGKSHFDMHLPRYSLRVNKSDVRIRLAFAPNALLSAPSRVTGKRYAVDLLALGAPAQGTLRVGSNKEMQVRGFAALTHTVAKKDETDLALRRIELVSQRGTHPFYAVQFLDEDEDRTSWAVWLEPRCDPAFAPAPFPGGKTSSGEIDTQSTKNALDRCIRVVRSSSKIEVKGRRATKGRTKRGGKDPYWIPPQFSVATTVPRITSTPPTAPAGPGAALDGSVTTGTRLLKYEALDDLPGPIRFVARLSTRPRRVWSLASFDVTLPPSLDFEPISIQSPGVSIVSFLNPVTRP